MADAAPAARLEGSAHTPPPPPSPPGRFEEGRSYWDIVSGQFLKNRPAVWGLRVVVLLFLSAILAPLLANDKPLVIHGKFRSLYERSFREWKFAAHMDLARLPAARAKVLAAWDDLSVEVKELRSRLKGDEFKNAGMILEHRKERMAVEDQREFRWKNDVVPLKDVRAALTPEEWAQVESTIRRVRGDLPAEFEVKQADVLRTIALKLTYLASQLGPEARRLVAERLDGYRTAAGDAGYLESGGAAESPAQKALAGLREELARALDPKTVTLEERWASPLIKSLHAGDVFFIMAMLCFALVRPVVRCLFRWEERLPQSRRMLYGLGVVLLPAAAAALLWTIRPMFFESADYKRELRDGGIEADFVVTPMLWYGTNEDHLEERFRPAAPEAILHREFWLADSGSRRNIHLLGTDESGRDLLTRLLWGGRISLSVGFVSVTIFTVIGVFLGSLAGYYRGWVDLLISRIIEWMLCVPTFFLILAAVAFLPPSIYTIMLVIGLTGWTTEARLMRGEFLRLGDQEYVLAAKALGVPEWRIIFRHILPNSMAPILVAATFGIASAMLTESALSFLGFGVQIPDTSWGSCLSSGRENFRYLNLVLSPGAAIFLGVTVYNLVGEGIRDAMDPRLKI